jgi:hypothetical protein
MLDFASEATKKERRNLLASGYAGVIVSRLGSIPTEIDLLGLKFNSPDLSWVVILGLIGLTAYSLFKFLTSCFMSGPKRR